MRIIFVFLSLLLLVCCNTTTESSYSVFEEDSWHADSIITFNNNVADSITKQNLYLKIRHSTDFEYQNIFLFVDFQEKRDTIEVILSEKNGKWLGSGFGDVKEVEFCLAKEIIFNSKKASKVTVEQAMRYGEQPVITNLKGIIALGINIKKSED
ncbi:MAG: gliding motility lipoprotein GldH [Flavobacteriales bacterium]